MNEEQCKYCPPDGECECAPEWCHCDPDGIAICAGHVKEREAQLRKELKAANKGAQTSALINQSLAKQLAQLREKLAAADWVIRRFVFKCDDLDHYEGEYHKAGADCPVLAEIQQKIAIIHARKER